MRGDDSPALMSVSIYLSLFTVTICAVNEMILFVFVSFCFP